MQAEATLLITAGDPAGIGPEIVVKALAAGLPDRTAAAVVGYPSAFETLSAELRGALPIRTADSGLAELPDGVLNLILPDGADPGPVRPGAAAVAGGKAAGRAIEKALSLCLEIPGTAMVTAPIDKASFNQAGYPHPGHTEFLKHLTGAEQVVMMMAGGPLRVALLTTHLPLRQVPTSLTRDKVVSTVLLVERELCRFGEQNPTIGLASLNPHAGDAGLLGDEEERVLVPAIEELLKRGLDVRGPIPGDSVYSQAAAGELSVVVAPYHDHGLIPVKLIAPRRAVNITLGLPIVRTSPDHGTAYDIAGRGIARPESLLEAIKAAVDLISRDRQRPVERS